MEVSLTLTGTLREIQDALVALESSGQSSSLVFKPEFGIADSRSNTWAEETLTEVRSLLGQNESAAALTAFLTGLNDLTFNRPQRSKDRTKPGALLFYPEGPVYFGAVFMLDIKRQEVLIRLRDTMDRPAALRNSDANLGVKVNVSSEQARKDADFLIRKAYELYRSQEPKRGHG